jgi:hypothetical protein
MTCGRTLRLLGRKIEADGRGINARSAGRYDAAGGYLILSPAKQGGERMRCVCCGYEPTKAEQVEQPYGCPKCEPEAYVPPVGAQLKACAANLAGALRRRLTQGSAKAR